MLQQSLSVGKVPLATGRPSQRAPFSSRQNRARRTIVAQAEILGGGYPPSGGNGGNGGGNGGWGGGGSGKGGSGKGGSPFALLAAGFRDRMAADPEYVFKVLTEQIIGVGASVLGDMSSRKDWGIHELDFVFATLIVGSIINFSLMWFLAPTASAGSASASFTSKFFGDYFLRKMGAPPGHMFERGFPVSARVANFMYKGTVFATIGVCAGLLGTVISNSLIALRKATDPNFVQQNESPNVLANAGCWALHMGLSSNARYQVLNGMDMVIQPMVPQGAFRLITSVVRSANNVIGGISFVMIAKMFGVQKGADSEEPEVGGKTTKKNRKGKKNV
jgi:hypothetical protein